MVRIYVFFFEKLEFGLLVFGMDGCDVIFEMRKFMDVFFGQIGGKFVQRGRYELKCIYEIQFV